MATVLQPLNYKLYDSPDFNDWLRSAKPGALYRDVHGRVYVMTFFTHRRIIELDIAQALVHRDHVLMQRILRVQKTIRFWFSIAAVELVILLTGLVVVL